MADQFYKISEVADLLGIEQHTLRYLENALKLKIQRNERSDRLYSESDLDTLRLILALKAKGLNTTAIKLALENSEEQMETGLQASPRGGTGKEAVEILSLSHRILEQNEELLKYNRNLQERVERLEKKIDQRNQDREKKIDEFLQLWKAEQQGKGKTWLSWLRGKT
ncbi:MAG TPA: MerR family transcriptional regulator [Syntrophomonadaceae bacterium]|nr:MerR family transcriptional regulator [Syntrophomonadaceae bacterium]